jgi:hypothetical protein
MYTVEKEECVSYILSGSVNTITGKKFKLYHEQKLFLFAWGDCYQTRNAPA